MVLCYHKGGRINACKLINANDTVWRRRITIESGFRNASALLRSSDPIV
jgi:hypothetical protein